MDEAWECLGSLETDRALEIGKELIRMRYSGGFEIAALAHLQNDAPEDAVSILEKGVDLAPEAWTLWQLLGNCYSEDDRIDEAMKCYQRALECPEVDPNPVHLNIAIALSRAGQYERSNAELMFVTSPETQPRKYAIRLGNYAEQKRWSDIMLEASALFPQLIEINDEEVTIASASDLSRIMSRWAEASIEVDESNLDFARDYAISALEFDSQNEIALRVIRRCDNEYKTRDDSLYRILVEGKWDEPFEGEDDVEGFYSTYWVLAASPEEALGYAKNIEKGKVAATMRLEDWDTEPTEAADDLKGVYGRSGYQFFKETT